MDPSIDSVVRQDTPDPLSLVSGEALVLSKDYKRISIGLDWAAALNSFSADVQNGHNLSAIEKLIQGFGYILDDQHPDLHVLAPPRFNYTVLPWCVSTI